MITFPPLPRGSLVTPHLIRTGGDLVSQLGGPTQRITRIGSRYACDVQLPTLDPDCGAQWISCPLQAEATGDTLGLVMPQTLDVGLAAQGVTGSGTAGSNTVTYTGNGPVPGLAFSIQAGGRHYLHFVTAVGGSTLTVAPLLRVTFSLIKLEFAAPVLEGFADDTAWSLEYFRFVGHKFTITESA